MLVSAMKRETTELQLVPIAMLNAADSLYTTSDFSLSKKKNQIIVIFAL